MNLDFYDENIVASWREFHHNPISNKTKLPCTAEELKEIHESFCFTLCLSMIINGKTLEDFLYLLIGAVSSGWPFTAEFNSMLTGIIMYSVLVIF
jgi:hypothetical protein